MAGNRGATTLRRSKRRDPGLRDYDALPPELRNWVASASLPWRARSVRAAFEKAVAKHGCRTAALQELDKIEKAMLAKDASAVWGGAYPSAQHQRG
ncbi:MAG: DUF6525 family protein [Pseudomonadota bacterium]